MAESLYVCLFSNGNIKVGRSLDPKARIAQHVDRVACLGVDLADYRTFACVADAPRAEADLISCCASYPGATRFQSEWFAGIEFLDVVSWAERFSSTVYEERQQGAFAVALRRARQAKDMTQAELGSALGAVSKATVSHWEIGRHEPNLSQFRGICTVLGVSADDLLDIASAQA